MSKGHRGNFYKIVGALVKKRRLELGYTEVQLGKLVGEQNKTIRSIEAGTPCSLHHIYWMDKELNIGIEDIYNHRELLSGEKINEEKEIKSLADLI